MMVPHAKKPYAYQRPAATIDLIYKHYLQALRRDSEYGNHSRGPNDRRQDRDFLENFCRPRSDSSNRAGPRPSRHHYTLSDSGHGYSDCPDWNGHDRTGAYRYRKDAGVWHLAAAADGGTG